MDGLDKKSTAPSHTRKVICPHCKTEVNYRNLTRHIEIKHKQISDTKTFHVRDPQSNKVLKPTKLTSFYGVKRKDGDLENDSPRPCKKRNASGDSAVSLDFTSGDDDGDDDGDEDEEEVFKNLESEEDIRKKPTSGEEPEPVSGEDCVIEVAGGAEPHEEKEGKQESLAKEINLANTDEVVVAREEEPEGQDKGRDVFSLHEGTEGQQEAKEESLAEPHEEKEGEQESLAKEINLANIDEVVVAREEDPEGQDKGRDVFSLHEGNEGEQEANEEAVRDEETEGQHKGRDVFRLHEGNEEEAKEDEETESVQSTLLVKNNLLLTQVLVKLEKLTVNKEVESSSTEEKISELTLDEALETRFLLASSVSSLEALGFSYNQELNLFRCNECGSTISYIGEEDFTDRIQPNEFRNVKKKLRKHLMTSKHSKQVAQNKRDKEDQVKNMSANEKAGMIVGTFVYNIIKKRRPVRDLEEDLFLLHKYGLNIGNINHSYQLVYGLRPFFAAEVRAKKKCFFSTHMTPTAHLPAFGMTDDGATHKSRGRQFHGANMIVPDTENTDSPFRSMSLGVDVMSKGKTGAHLAASIKER